RRRRHPAPHARRRAAGQRRTRCRRGHRGARRRTARRTVACRARRRRPRTAAARAPAVGPARLPSRAAQRRFHRGVLADRHRPGPRAGAAPGVWAGAAEPHPGRGRRLGMNRPGTTAARRLLACGAASGPVFLGSLLAQAVWRPGFELGEHAISLLSRGEHGWTQITAFVLSGALVLAGALGVRGTLPRLVGTWTGVLLGLVGTGMVVMGVFVVDPGVGFPPDGEPPATSWSLIGVVHNLGTAVAVNAAVLAALVLGWHGARTGAWAAALVCLTVAATV